MTLQVMQIGEVPVVVRMNPVLQMLQTLEEEQELQLVTLQVTQFSPFVLGDRPVLQVVHMDWLLHALQPVIAHCGWQVLPLSTKPVAH